MSRARSRPAPQRAEPFEGKVAQITRDGVAAIVSCPPGPPKRIDGYTVGVIPHLDGPSEVRCHRSPVPRAGGVVRDVAHTFCVLENASVPFPSRIPDLFGCRYPIQQAGMGGVATPDLALAVAAAGGLGMLSGTVDRRSLSAQLDAIPTGTAIGVNFLVPFLDRAAMDEAAGRSPYVEFFWGAPDSELVAAVHEQGSLVGWQVGAVDEASAAADAGCDVVVAQGIEAGGHVRGTVGLLALLDEVCRAVDLPVIAAGGIGTGRAMAAALTAGADAVRVGTRFVAALESTAHPIYVDALIGASAEDTVLTTAFGAGWPNAPHRVLTSSVEAGERLGSAQSWTPDWPSATFAGVVEARALYAGQSVGAVRSRQSAAEIVLELITEAEQQLGAVATSLRSPRSRP